MFEGFVFISIFKNKVKAKKWSTWNAQFDWKLLSSKR